MSILVTGGAGFIGSHTVLSLLNEQYDVVVIDNLCNSSPEAIKRVEKLAGRNLTFYHGDIRDSIFLEKIFNSNNIEAVIHCAALKSVGESNLLPLKYYSNNVAGALNLLQCMENNNVNKLIFSSSATVYGDTGKVPNSEADSIRRTTNPYGTSKYITEIVLEDIVSSSNSLSVISLRYFNPTGAHSSGLIGEDPNGIPSNLIPYVSKVAFGNLSRVNVFGCDYPTKDGTGIRDYIHVEDLALGHV